MRGWEGKTSQAPAEPGALCRQTLGDAQCKPMPLGGPALGVSTLRNGCPGEGALNWVEGTLSVYAHVARVLQLALAHLPLPPEAWRVRSQLGTPEVTWGGQGWGCGVWLRQCLFEPPDSKSRRKRCRSPGSKKLQGLHSEASQTPCTFGPQGPRGWAQVGLPCLVPGIE